MLVDFGGRSNFISLVVKRNIYQFLLTTCEIKFDLPPKSTHIHLFILLEFIKVTSNYIRYTVQSQPRSK